MRFTILSQYFPPEVGAAQIRLSAFARQLKQAGHDVQIVTAMPNYPNAVVLSNYKGKVWVKELSPEGLEITRTWIYPATGRNILKRLANYFSFTLTSLIGLFSVKKADILFVESPPLFLCLSAWLCSVIRRQKLCINISDLWPDSVVELGIMKESIFINLAYRLEHWLYKQAWMVCGVTEGIIERLVKEKNVRLDRTQFLPNGVDCELFKQMSPDAELLNELGGEGKCIFAYTGIHGYAQGLELIIQTAEQLRGNPNILFLFVGDGPEKSRLQKLSKDKGLANVTFLNAQPVTEMPRIFSIVTACIVPLLNLPLFTGARPSKMFPPLACCKPIIYSGKGEAAKIVIENNCGLVTTPENTDDLVKAIIYMIDNPAKTEAMGLSGGDFVRAEYSWSRIVTKWLENF